MIRLVRTAGEFREFCKEVRNRQYEPNPATIEFVNDSFENIEPYDWRVMYLKVTRTNNHDYVEVVKHYKSLISQHLRYPHIFNVMGIPEDKIYL
jgi:hypothetical protein